jgi:hypothetical protein
LIVLPGADVIAIAAVVDVDERVQRLALTIDERKIIRDCVDDNDALALQEALEFFRITDADLPGLLDGPFTPRASAPGKPFAEGRFSNGDHAVFYTAREPDTAGHEYAHSAPKYFGASLGPKVQFRIHLIDCRFAGTASELRLLATDFPGLVADAHDFCHEVGRAGVAARVDGFLATSVRHPGGTTIPVFSRPTLSDPRKVGDALCEVDAVAGKAIIRFV